MKTKNWEIDEYSSTTLIVDVYNYRMANRLNKTLQQYVDDKIKCVRIKEGEEPRFFVKKEQSYLIKAPLKIKALPDWCEK